MLAATNTDLGCKNNDAHVILISANGSAWSAGSRRFSSGVTMPASSSGRLVGMTASFNNFRASPAAPDDSSSDARLALSAPAEASLGAVRIASLQTRAVVRQNSRAYVVMHAASSLGCKRPRSIIAQQDYAQAS